MEIEKKHPTAQSEREEILQQREELPVRKSRKEIIAEIKRNQTIVIMGETGCGKTTQIPQFLLEANLANDKKIGVTQPRRVAAITLAQRVSKEIGDTVGERVGYRVRFEEKMSKRTRIEFMTDGMLLRTALIEPDLKSYGVIVLDEAHERTVHTDILIGLLKGIIEKRNDLKVVIMSATLDSKLFSNFFNGPTLTVPGRQHPIEVFNLDEKEDSPIDVSVDAILQIHITEETGDILVFLPGQESIETVESTLLERLKKAPITVKPLLILPLYSALPPEQQLLVFQAPPEGTRKVVLSTNIAETSVTIPGVRYVVDTGMMKCKEYNKRIGMEALKTMFISQAQSLQRTGRAGREAPGKCFRLFTKSNFDKFQPSPTPEIQRTSLDGVVLQLKALNVVDVTKFKFLEPPPEDSIIRAEISLEKLGAVVNKRISDLGKIMVALPVSPPYAKTIIAAAQSNCLEHILCIVAMLAVDTQFFVSAPAVREKSQMTMKMYSSDFGDHFMLLSLFLAFRKVGVNRRKKWCVENALNFKALSTALSTHNQLVEYCVDVLDKELKSSHAKEQCTEEKIKKMTNEAVTDEIAKSIKKAFLVGFPDNVAIKQPNNVYLTTTQKAVHIHPSSCLHNKKIQYVLFSELIYTTKPFIRSVLALDKELVLEEMPHLISD
ncbi:ATP-dependent RNA helicase, putative [Entamoeba invadens IP1]|uniref:RNA helicase n=1 Tax=Entamoeba invadens IP1 TaxID=370355 RepID=A0A0A1UCE1_ENTIV|nr:ATP-dependent RNA helicase, putative [Entamoeba invadens IP1]ELP92906.1 ATP-dependent RNA helicase, putative [Entamoeba invadens IP1]|eukprot:XP_004259677.1 ATP-dependent RNA helicase, putative [Entamoeba invadens IP1]